MRSSRSVFVRERRGAAWLADALASEHYRVVAIGRDGIAAVILDTTDDVEEDAPISLVRRSRARRCVEAHEMHVGGDMESFGRVEDALARLRRELYGSSPRSQVSLGEYRISPESRACVEQYLDDVAPCVDALEAAMNLSDELDVFEHIAESIASIGDEIATMVVEQVDEEMLPEIIELARVEREGLAEDVRALRGSVSSRARIALDALAVSLTSMRLHHGRRAA